jgi:hypothetical protein
MRRANMEGAVTTSDADVPEFLTGADSISVEEQARRLGARPIKSLHELRCDVWESDEELDEFLADLAESRRSSIT